MLLTLPIPPSINQTYNTVRGYIYKTRKARDWEDEAGWCIKKTRRSHGTSSYDLTDRLYVGLTYFFNRERDIDSGLKITLDLLQRMKVIENDKQIYHLNIKKEKDMKKPRVEIEIIKL